MIGLYYLLLTLFEYVRTVREKSLLTRRYYKYLVPILTKASIRILVTATGLRDQHTWRIFFMYTKQWVARPPLHPLCSYKSVGSGRRPVAVTRSGRASQLLKIRMLRLSIIMIKLHYAANNIPWLIQIT